MTDAQPQRIKPLAAAEASVRRLLLMVGFGFIAWVGGSIFAASLAVRLATRFDSDALKLVLAPLVDGAWVLLALPVIAHLAARFMDIRPWASAIIGALTGFVFQMALSYVSTGVEGIASDPMRLTFRIATLVGGIVITAVAVKRGRAAAAVAEVAAKVEAEKKKSQYDEFVKQSEALADRREQVPIAPAAPPAEAAAPTADSAPHPDPLPPQGRGST